MVYITGLVDLIQKLVTAGPKSTIPLNIWNIGGMQFIHINHLKVKKIGFMGRSTIDVDI